MEDHRDVISDAIHNLIERTLHVMAGAFEQAVKVSPDHDRAVPLTRQPLQKLRWDCRGVWRA
jgi:hypothetical protein